MLWKYGEPLAVTLRAYGYDERALEPGRLTVLGADVLADCSGSAILVVNHTGWYSVLQGYLEAARWKLSCFVSPEYGPSPAELAAIEAAGTGREYILSGTLASAFVAREALRRPRRLLLWQPDAKEAPERVSNRVIVPFLGWSRRMTTGIAMLAKDSGARVVFASCRILSDPVIGGLLEFHEPYAAHELMALSDEDWMSRVCAEAERMILSSIDQWRCWKFVKDGVLG
jgi:lauroyl/myristoyl acyltransferase